MYGKPKESDWKLFRDMLPELREKYLAKKNREIQAIFKDPERTPTEKFWDAEKRIRKEAEILRDCLDDYRRSNMDLKVMLMRRYGMLEQEDVAKFSEEFQQEYRRFYNQ